MKIIRMMLLTLSLVFAGCATTTGTQADCFAKNEKFSAAASCMRGEMSSLKWKSNAPLSMLKDYENYLNVIEAKVKKGELSDEDGKLRMQEYLLRLRNSYN